MNPFSSIGDTRRALNNREISVTELTQFFLDRVNATNDRYNCFVSVDEASALATAQRLDQKSCKAPFPLAGIPIAHKDVFCVKGTKTTCCSRMLQNFVAPYDATVVRRMADADAVCLGKTNMDEFAMGSSNRTSIFGPVRNPWDLDRVPGGSSGGSAAAVAAGLVMAATGTDTGGSIRQPAAFCGITGFKPTYGRISRYGMVAFASSLDQAGVFARNAEDVGLALSVMEGRDQNDSTSAHQLATNICQTRRPLTLGICPQQLEPLSSQQTACLETARNELERAGHRFVDIALPHTDVASAVYYVISSAEASTNLSRFDGVRYGHRSEKTDSLHELYRHTRDEGFGIEVKRRILTGTYVLSVGYFDAYYIQAQKVRRLIQQDFVETFDDVDLILSPTAPSTAFNIDELRTDPIQMYLQDVYTVPVSLAGLPAINVPCGFVDDLPVGMQLIGKHFDEATVLAAAREFQQLTDTHLKHPPIAP